MIISQMPVWPSREFRMPSTTILTCRDWSFCRLRHRFLTFTLWICSALTSISAFADELKVDEVQRLIDAYTRKHPTAVVAAKIIRPAGDLFVTSGEFIPEGVFPPDKSATERSDKQKPNDKPARSADEHSLFALASVTKTFTGVLLALLAEKQVLSLGDPASDYLPQAWKLPSEHQAGIERKISLVELATHSSGLPVQPPDIASFARQHQTENNPYSLYDHKALEQSLSGVKLSHPIGEKYLYSNLGMGLLGHALADATKAADFESALRTHLLDPLELHETRFHLTPEMQTRRVPTFNQQGIAAPTWSFATLEACGGLHSSIHDLTRWVKAHWPPPDDAEKPLAGQKSQSQQHASAEISAAFANSLKTHFPKQPDPLSTKLQMGLGWHLITIPLPKNTTADNHKNEHRPRMKRIAFHAGATTASRSFVALDAEQRVGVILLANVPHSLDQIGIQMMQQLLTHE